MREWISAAAGGLGKDRAAGLTVRPLATDTRQPGRHAILTAQEMRLLPASHSYQPSASMLSAVPRSSASRQARPA
ncbi:hypothetical protein QWY79_13790, partial [Halomonas sabkhae]|uniref:hypothetical protein n=1 Tax=Halomonas sabkhae TaxID=626223 RepID=UPI0025B4F4A2